MRACRVLWRPRGSSSCPPPGPHASPALPRAGRPRPVRSGTQERPGRSRGVLV